MGAIRDAEAIVAESEREILASSQEIDAGQTRIRFAKSEIDKKRALLSRDADCPTCARVLSPADIERLNKLWDDELRFCASEGEELQKSERRRNEARNIVVENQIELAKKRAALIDRGAHAVSQYEKNLAKLDQELASLTCPDSKTDLDRQVAMNENALDLAESKLSDLLNRQHLAQERDKKRREAAQATLVAAGRKAELEKLEALRSEILEESRSALKAALSDEDHALAPHGGRYTLDIGEGGLEFGYATGAYQVPWRALSTGEKTVATTVLSVALRRLLGQLPWSALLIDNLEVVSLGERERLVQYVRGLSGLVSNVLLISSDDRGLGEPALRL